MAKLIYASNMSLDGCTEDEHGAFDWAPPYDDVFTFITDLMRSAGTYLYGRRMYDTMAVWETEPAMPHSRTSSATSRTPGRWRTRLSTPRLWLRCQPPTPGSNATSTRARYTA